MNWDFFANTQDELQGVHKVLLTGKFSNRVAFEKLQMAHLLSALARSVILDYPLGVKHTTDQIPDFQLVSGKRRIAVELTRIKFQDLEHARALQANLIRSSLSVSALYPKSGGPRKKSTVIQDGFGVPAMVFPVSPAEQEKAWLAQAEESLTAKTTVLMRNTFVHGDEDWLVLVDPIGELMDIQLQNDSFSMLLKKFWGPGWYSRVFVQDVYFRWQIAYSASKSEILCVENTVAPKEILDQTFRIDPSLFADE